MYLGCFTAPNDNYKRKKACTCAGFFDLAEQAGFEPAVGY